jgi:hypothetical protein
MKPFGTGRPDFGEVRTTVVTMRKTAAAMSQHEDVFRDRQVYPEHRRHVNQRVIAAAVGHVLDDDVACVEPFCRRFRGRVACFSGVFLSQHTSSHETNRRFIQNASNRCSAMK